jgi:hypothetical protein
MRKQPFHPRRQARILPHEDPRSMGPMLAVTLHLEPAAQQKRERFALAPLCNGIYYYFSSRSSIY